MVIFECSKRINLQLFIIKFIRERGVLWITAADVQSPQIKIIELEEKEGNALLSAYSNNFEKIVDLLDIQQDELIFNA